MKKTFPCGHKGKGQYCHRCEESQRQEALKQIAKGHLIKQATATGMDLSNLPTEIVKKVIDMVTKLREGVPYTSFKGSKRLVKRKVLSIPVGRTYRMLCRDEGGKVIPVEVLTHEAYNSRVKYVMTHGL